MPHFSVDLSKFFNKYPHNSDLIWDLSLVFPPFAGNSFSFMAELTGGPLVFAGGFRADVFRIRPLGTGEAGEV